MAALLAARTIGQIVLQDKKGLSFISNRQRRKEGTFCASELAGIEPTPAHSRRVGYARLNLSATATYLQFVQKRIDATICKVSKTIFKFRYQRCKK
jgi:hypothetical protein